MDCEDNSAEGVPVPGFSTPSFSSDSSFSWLSQLSELFNSPTISLPVSSPMVSTEPVPGLTPAPVAAPVPAAMPVSAPIPVPGLTSAPILVPIPLPIPVPIPVSIPVPVLATVPASALAPASEFYLEMPLPPKAEYFSQEDLLTNVKNHVAGNGYAVIINGSRPTKLYLVCDQETKYQN